MAIQIRRGTDAEWESNKSNIVAGEPAVAMDTERMFIGTGSGTYMEVANIEVLADAFDSSASYVVGDFVSYHGKVYKCNTDHSGAWNASHFDEVALADALDSLGDDVYTKAETDALLALKADKTEVGTLSNLTTTNKTDLVSAVNEVKGDIPSVPSPSNANPQMDGTASAGVSNDYSRADHVHPSDTSKANVEDFDSITSIGTQLFDKDNAETEHWLPANGTVSAGANSTSVIIPVKPSVSDNYITVHRDTISSRFTVATFTSKPVVGSSCVTEVNNNSASSITVACSTSIKYIMVLVHNAAYDTAITVQTMLNGLMVEFGSSFTGYEPYSFGVIIPPKSVSDDSFSDDAIDFIEDLIGDSTQSEKVFVDANRKESLSKSDITLTWTEGSYYSLTTGDVTNLSGRSHTDKYDCNAGDRISVTQNKGQILFWNANGVLLSYESTIYNATLTAIAPNNAVKYAFNNSDSTIRGVTATKYESTNPIVDNEYIAPAKLIYDSNDFISGKYCSTTNGNISSSANYYCLPFVPVKSNHKYRTQTQTQVVFYDSSLAFISSILPANLANYTGTPVEMDFTTPATCKYISINSKSEHEQLYDLDYTVLGFVDNPQKLQGKTVVCFGDSITGNYGFGDNYPSRIEEFTGAKTYNCGFGGCRMENISDDTQHTNAFSMVGIVDALEAAESGDTHAWDDMDTYALSLSDTVYFRLQILKSIDWSKVDIVTIAYGTNEGGYPQDDENNKYNKQTYAGATRYSIEKLLTLYPKLRIVLLTPIFRYYTNEQQDSDTRVNPTYGGKLTDNVATLISVGHEYKIPVLDLYYTLGINITNYTSYFGDEDEQSDGTHINSFGREQFGKRVAGELNRLF